ncbi:MAG: alpha-E domain-containing protein [Pseudomonadota bacterium]
MLSRTASSLFWLARYVERAENTARILDGTGRIASLPSAFSGKTNEWESALISAGARDAFDDHYDTISRENVIEFLAFSPANPSSIRSCFEGARQNARSVRTALTIPVWEAINGAWLDMMSFDMDQMRRHELARFLNWVKNASLQTDGSADRTMLRNDSYAFLRLGTYIERADNTARILDVKYHLLLPDQVEVGGGLDYYQWAAILRSVSALTAYHWVYRDSLKPWLIADLLILKEEMPRSLLACYREITDHLQYLADAYGRQGESQRTARSTYARLSNTSVERIFQAGLHEFLLEFIGSNNQLGGAVLDQYLH